MLLSLKMSRILFRKMVTFFISVVLMLVIFQGLILPDSCVAGNDTYSTAESVVKQVLSSDSRNATAFYTNFNQNDLSQMQTKMYQPLTQGGTLYSVNGVNYTNNATISCVSSKPTLEVLIQFSSTHDLNFIKFTYNINKQSVGATIEGPISGACADGFIKCEPGTWQGCTYYKWIWDNSTNSLKVKEVLPAELHACYCFNSACSSASTTQLDNAVMDSIVMGIFNTLRVARPDLILGKIEQEPYHWVVYSQSPSSCNNQNVSYAANDITTNYASVLALFSKLKSEGNKTAEAEESDQSSAYWAVMHSALPQKGYTVSTCGIFYKFVGLCPVGSIYSKTEGRCIYTTNILGNTGASLSGYFGPLGTCSVWYSYYIPDYKTVNLCGAHLHKEFTINSKMTATLVISGDNNSNICDNDILVDIGYVEVVVNGTVIRKYNISKQCFKSTETENIDLSGAVGGKIVFDVGVYNGPEAGSSQRVQLYINNILQCPSGWLPDLSRAECYKGAYYEIFDNINFSVYGSYVSGGSSSFLYNKWYLIEKDDGCKQQEEEGCRLVDEKICFGSSCIRTVVNGIPTGVNPVKQCYSSPLYPGENVCFDGKNVYLNGNIVYSGVSGEAVWPIVIRTYVCPNKESNVTVPDLSYLTQNVDSKINSSDFGEYNPSCIQVCKIRLNKPVSEVSSEGEVKSDYNENGTEEEIIYRPCENGTCPLKPGETLVHDCYCPDNFGKTVSYFKVLDQLGQNVMCSSGTSYSGD